MKKDPLNCPFCEAEIKGYSDGWGFSPEGWEEMLRIHKERHCEESDDSKDAEPSD